MVGIGLGLVSACISALAYGTFAGECWLENRHALLHFQGRSPIVYATLSCACSANKEPGSRGCPRSPSHISEL